MTSIFRGSSTPVRRPVPNSYVHQTPVATQRAEADLFVQAEAPQNKAKARMIQAGQRIFEQLAILEKQEAQTQTKKILNRSAEMTHTSNNPQLSQPSKVLVLKLMNEIFGQDDNLSIIEFRKRLEAVILEKTEHFLGFEF